MQTASTASAKMNPQLSQAKIFSGRLAKASSVIGMPHVPGPAAVERIRPPDSSVCHIESIKSSRDVVLLSRRV
jgi:hypothetical protein